MTSVVQDWVVELPLMQQSVLLSGIRGCDGLPKGHPAKAVVRWYRRCVLLSAFDGRALTDPFEPGGGSFTGPIWSKPNYTEDLKDQEDAARQRIMANLADQFLVARDELPLHYYTHMMHAFQIVGYKHPTESVRLYFRDLYFRMAHAFHLWPESPEDMDRRLGDNEGNWKAREDCAGGCST